MRAKENILKVNSWGGGGALFIAGCPHQFHTKCCGFLHNMPVTLTCHFVPAAMSPTAQSCIFIALQMVADGTRCRAPNCSHSFTVNGVDFSASAPCGKAETLELEEHGKQPETKQGARTGFAASNNQLQREHESCILSIKLVQRQNV